MEDQVEVVQLDDFFHNIGSTASNSTPLPVNQCTCFPMMYLCFIMDGGEIGRRDTMMGLWKLSCTWRHHEILRKPHLL